MASYDEKEYGFELGVDKILVSHDCWFNYVVELLSWFRWRNEKEIGLLFISQKRGGRYKSLGGCE